ncbi:uncharacterized protein BDW43DRAFT_305432 [Aspergillus alliaceus]|uniref:uncharacterized protein n=1 Tax=Petromyces alliaceus TaxID=209559 RepID=UPI0012A4E89C|nr:uncharacterized protein BDW43DRAFT_305432 [Aspergillus alliaceus]KAB8239665.1 hypothetical protein BDW43DRAFT_305432 [Aspergillus alliaceus]
MTFTYRDGIAVLQLIAFIPALNLALYLCYKQGLKAVASCWRFLLILSCLRIAGAVCQLLLISHASEDVVVTKIVCDLLGIAPLTLAAVGLLQRVNETAKQVSRYTFMFVSIVSMVGLIIGIVGAVQAVNGANYKVTSLLKAALALFIVCLGLMFLILFYLSWDIKSLPVSEQRVIYSLYLCSPLLVVRMVYAALSDYGSDPRFALFDGSPTAYLCMSVLEEIVLMIICLMIGFMYPPPVPDRTANKLISPGSLEASKQSWMSSLYR